MSLEEVKESLNLELKARNLRKEDKARGCGVGEGVSKLAFI